MLDCTDKLKIAKFANNKMATFGTATYETTETHTPVLSSCAIVLKPILIARFGINE